MYTNSLSNYTSQRVRGTIGSKNVLLNKNILYKREKIFVYTYVVYTHNYSLASMANSTVLVSQHIYILTRIFI